MSICHNRSDAWLVAEALHVAHLYRPHYDYDPMGFYRLLAMNPDASDAGIDEEDRVHLPDFRLFPDPEGINMQVAMPAAYHQHDCAHPVAMLVGPDADLVILETETVRVLDLIYRAAKAQTADPETMEFLPGVKEHAAEYLTETQGCALSKAVILADEFYDNCYFEHMIG